MASDYPYSGFNDPQAYKQQQQQQQQQQQSRMPDQQQDSQIPQYNNPQISQQANFDPYSAAQFSQYGGSQYTSMQPSSSSSSLRNNDNQRFSMIVRHPIRGGMPGNAMVPPSPSRSSSSAKAPRARVNMACVHCRSRKIRCDGNQPMCATCSRLGRVCVYENISEQENAAVRDKKRKSREAKQARLDALTQLGVSMPRQQSSTGTHDSYRQRPYPSYSGGGIRSQYQNTNVANNQGMMPPSFPQQQSIHRTWQSQVPTSQYLSTQVQNDEINNNSAAATLTRRRGATVGGFETNENETETESNLWQRDNTNNNVNLSFTQAKGGENAAAAATTSTETTENVGVMYDGIVPRLHSLSQPATPEATYRFHASMLSHELATTSSTSTGQPSPQDNSFFNSFQPQPSTYSLGPSAYQTTNMNTNNDNGGGSNSSAGSFSVMPAMQSSLSEDNLYSAGSMYMTRPDQYGNFSSMTQIVNANQPFQTMRNVEDQFGGGVGGDSNQNPTELSNEAFELNEEQRRRSVEEKKIWRRTTNSDAAIARFFARVVAAREGETENNDVPICGPGGYNISAWSQNTNLSLAQDTSIASSSASSWSGQEISGLASNNTIAQTNNEGQNTAGSQTGQQSNAHTPESTGQVRRGSGVSLLSQPSILPISSANNTPPSDIVASASFRSQRPPPLRFDSLPTFAQQHTHNPSNAFVESPLSTIQGSGTNMSTSFNQQRIQPSVLTPLSAASSSIPLRSPSYINPNLSPGSHSNSISSQPTIINQSGSPLTATISRPFQTPITELSSHLFAMGHSRGPSEGGGGTTEEHENFINQQQQQQQ